MTVSQIRSYMAEKVIPESVMPQNISACLMDEDDHVVPELDAFTFLNRVRALGIGSADFLYLLKGCGAPEEAIEKIESNPAMNLQNLIVTLDSSGLTSQDYTRMLYTARQVWERTLTMRMDKKQLDKFREDHDPVTVMLDKADLPTELLAQEQSTDDLEDDPVTEFIPHSGYADIDDDPPTELLSAGNSPADRPVYTARQLPAEEQTDELPEQYPEQFPTEQPDDEPLEQFIARQLQDDDDISDDDDAEDFDEQPEILTARQKPKKEYIGRDDYDEFYDENKPVARYNGKIAVSAVFAALLLGLSAAMDVFGFAPPEQLAPAAVYAADNADIFADIHTAYTSGKLGADGVFAYTADRGKVFGNMLIQQPDSLGVFSLGSRAFAAEPELITVYEAVDGTAVEVFTLQPPEGAQYIEMAQSDDVLTAVYADADSAGIIAYNADGQTLYSAEQSGVLTDVYMYMDTVSLGTVYTPPFRQSFTVDQSEHYLPQFTLDGSTSQLQPSEVILTPQSQGCSYAVYGSYSTKDGSLTERAAVLGDPVFSGAEDLFAVMRGDSGFTLVGSDGQQPFTQQTASLIACDIGDTFVAEFSETAEPFDSTPAVKREQALVATAETDAEGTRVYLRGFDLSPISAITNISGTVASLRISGGILYIYGENGVLMAADISSPEAPVILQLTAAQGVIKGEKALCSSISGNMVKLTLYTIDEQTQTATETGSTSRIVTLAQGKEVSMSGGNTVYIGEELCGAAFEYFDGVSRIAEYPVFGRTKTTQTLFDKGGFVCAAQLDGALYLIYEGGSLKIN